MVVVWALDRVLAEVPVTHDEPGGGRMTVALERSATVIGRLVRDGEPVAKSPVEVVGLFGGRSALDATRRDAVTGPDGRFRIEGVGAGPHRFRAPPADTAPVVLDDLAPVPPETLDLGDVEVGAGGAIAGSVVVPAGVTPSGLVVQRGSNREGGTVVVDARGTFRFDMVEVGAHDLIVEGRRGELARSLAFPVEVVDGETATVELDLRDRAMVEVALTLDLGGLDAEGVFVRLVSVDRPEARDPLWMDEYEQRLGFADAAGVARGRVRAMGAATIEVASTELGLVEHPTARIDLRPGAPIERVLRFDWTGADLRFPAAPALPAVGELVLEIESTDGPVRKLRFRVRDGALLPSPFASLDGATLHVNGLRAGEVTIRASIPGPDGAEDPLWSYSAEATLVAGETAAVALH